MDDKPKNKPVSLAEALQFTDAELEANRNGILADTQINLIYPRQTTNKLPIYLALGVFGFLLIPLILLGAWRSGSTFWTIALGIVELGLLVAFGYFVYHAHDDLNADIEGRVVEQVSGVVTFRIAGSTPVLPQKWC